MEVLLTMFVFGLMVNNEAHERFVVHNTLQNAIHKARIPQVF